MNNQSHTHQSEFANLTLSTESPGTNTQAVGDNGTPVSLTDALADVEAAISNIRNQHNCILLDCDKHPNQAECRTEQVLELLQARDEIARVLKHQGKLDKVTSNRLLHIDRELSDLGSTIATDCNLKTLRQSFHPPEEFWWWFFEAPTHNPGIDWLWNGFTAALLGVTASLSVTMLQAFAVNGISWTQALGTLAQGAGLAVLGGGILTTEGHRKLNQTLSRLNIPQQCQGVFMVGVSGVICGITYWGYVEGLPKSLIAQGQTAYEAGSLQESESHYQKALALAPYSVEALLGLGQVYESIDRNEDAINYYQKALFSGNPEAFNNLSRTYLASLDPTGQIPIPPDQIGEITNKANIAETLLRLGLQRANENPQVSPDVHYQLHRNLGWLLMWQKRYDSAIVELKQAIKIDDNIPGQEIGGYMAQCLLAEIYNRQKQPKLAAEQHQICVAKARPESIREFNWFIAHRQSDLADCIDTSGVVTGLLKKPIDGNPKCQKFLKK